MQEQIRQKQSRSAVTAADPAGGEAIVNTISITNETKLLAAGNPHDHFGHAVAIHGDRMVVGMPDADINGNADQGTVYVFKRSDGKWLRTHRIFDPRGRAGDRFGAAVDMDDSGIVVGAPGYDGRDGMHPDRGAAYIFYYDEDRYEWQQVNHFHTLGAAGDRVGSAVARANYITIIGAPGTDIVRNNVLYEDQGAVHVFQSRADGTWETRRFVTPTAYAQAHDWFGHALAMNDTGDMVLVGAPQAFVNSKDNQGAVHVLRRNGATGDWVFGQRLIAPQTSDNRELFGWSISLGVTRVLIGAPRSDAVQFDAGAAFIFSGSNGIWNTHNVATLGSGEAGSQFGWSVALHNNVAVVGVPWANNAGNLSEGRVDVFVHNIDAWVQQPDVTVSDGAAFMDVGRSVALDGDTLVVGAPLASFNHSASQGAAYVFINNGTIFNADFREQQKLAAEGGGIDEFGQSVALDGNTLMVAGYKGVYVFTRGGTSWHMTQKLSYGGNAIALGGSAIALDGDVALIGNPYADNGKGMAYIFVFDGYIWREQARLSNPDGQNSSDFGRSVALDGDTALITAGQLKNNTSQGAVYVFTRSSSGEWSQQVKFVDPEGNQADNAFGWAVALDGDTALVGARYTDVNGNDDQGMVHVFTRSNIGQWSRQATLFDPEGKPDDYFGYAVALDGDTALIGALGAKNSTTNEEGAAYVFTRSGDTWSQQQKLIASDSSSGWDTGSAVALAGNTALIGAPAAENDVGLRIGAAYVFTFDGVTWREQARLTTSDGKERDYFGDVVALDGDIALVGADRVDIDGINQGAAYVYTLVPTPEVLDIARASASPTISSTVAYTVTFDMAVSGVSASNFALVTSGDLSGASIASVRGSGATWLVEVNTGTGSGTLRLDLTSADGITPPPTNAPFIGEEYLIERPEPGEPTVTPTAEPTRPAEPGEPGEPGETPTTAPGDPTDPTEPGETPTTAPGDPTDPTGPGETPTTAPTDPTGPITRTDHAVYLPLVRR